jgi:rhamnogalacturonan endolyase
LNDIILRWSFVKKTTFYDEQRCIFAHRKTQFHFASMKVYKQFVLLLTILFCFSPAPIQAMQRQMEYLDRGLVAVQTANGVFLSWRYLATDEPNVGFNIYRNGTVKINATPLISATNTIDNQGNTSYKYSVRAVLNGVEMVTSESVTPWSTIYKTIQLNRPAGGKNASGGYHYAPGDCSVGDLDGDGQYELIVKWDPTNAKDNSQSGYTGNVYLDAYELTGKFLWRIDLGINIRAGAHYTQYMVYDFDGDGMAEVACKTAPGTKDGTGAFVLMNNDSPTVDYRNSSGYILSGPEYLSIFNGQTGANIHTIAYNPLRGVVSNATWGDNYGNRVDRFMACVAYLDGIHPSLVMCRGYYTRTTLAAYNFSNGKLTQQWFYDSGTTSGVGAYGQGNHNLSVADVDNDGKDEIIYGACAINDDGKLLYRTGLGHGDAMHLCDLDPDIPGLEVWEVHEETGAAYGYELHTAATGKILWGTKTGTDNGRGCSADIDGTSRGHEMWSSSGPNVYTCKGDSLSSKKPSVNFRIYWDGDLLDELLDGTKLDKWSSATKSSSRLFTLYNYGNAQSINGTKATPCLSADILGDWREEIFLASSVDSSKIQLFTTTIPSSYRVPTLMHDPVYRLGVAWENNCYNQPPHLGYWLGRGLDSIPVPNVYLPHAEGVPTTQKTTESNPLTMLTEGNGIVRFRSTQRIIAVTVFSMTGILLYKNDAVHETEYSMTLPENQPMLLVQVKTSQGYKTFKWIRR